jgi:uncharacterized membrane protein
MITGLLFGPLIGGLDGEIGSILADFFLGLLIYAPATLVIKGLEGLLVGIISNPKRYFPKLKRYISGYSWRINNGFRIL